MITVIDEKNESKNMTKSHYDTFSSDEGKGRGLGEQLWTRVYLNLYKIFVVSALFSILFFETTNLLFYSIVSIAVGVGYYFLNESFPRFTVFLKVTWFIVKREISNSIGKIWRNLKTKTYFMSTNKIMLQLCPQGQALTLSRPRDQRPLDEDARSASKGQPNMFSFLTYYDNNMVGKKHKKHIFLFKEKLRLNDLIIFKDEFNNDITDLIEPYLGPLQNFHGSSLTPGDFNLKKLSVFRDGVINIFKTFDENEPIVLT